MTRRWWSRLTSGWTAPDPAPEPAYPYPDPADEAERIVREAQDRTRRSPVYIYDLMVEARGGHQ